MTTFVFRNNTVERFFPKDVVFSGYGDISVIPEAERYVWFYQVPLKNDTEALVAEVEQMADEFSLVFSRLNTNISTIALTMVPLRRAKNCLSDHRLERAVARYNECLYETEAAHANLLVLNLEDFLSAYPASEWFDWKFWFISQMGLNPRLAAPFKEWFAAQCHAMALQRKKCLVLDLDQTLWGGILGEDGLEGIQVGCDYPGKAFLYFQEALLALSHTGVLLAVCSKNNEADVLDVWERHPEMRLRKEHFAAWRINWNDKASNLRSLAAELNLGLDSFVFVDDNPTEREWVRQQLPMVEVPEFPSQPYELPGFFQQMVRRYFQVQRLTEEDKDKVAQYRANAERRQSEAAFGDFTSFLRDLDLHLRIEPVHALNRGRIVQMTQKTNQFNLTTRRCDEAFLNRCVESGWKIYALSVSDRFGDNGVTGCVWLEPLDAEAFRIDNFLLSCRILGKGIEFAFLKTVLENLRSAGIKKVQAAYLPTAKNAQVADFYDRCGFEMTHEDTQTPAWTRCYELCLTEAALGVEDYYQIEWADADDKSLRPK